MLEFLREEHVNLFAQGNLRHVCVSSRHAYVYDLPEVEESFRISTIISRNFNNNSNNNNNIVDNNDNSDKNNNDNNFDDEYFAWLKTFVSICNSLSIYMSIETKNNIIVWNKK